MATMGVEARAASCVMPATYSCISVATCRCCGDERDERDGSDQGQCRRPVPVPVPVAPTARGVSAVSSLHLLCSITLLLSPPAFLSPGCPSASGGANRARGDQASGWRECSRRSL